MQVIVCANLKTRTLNGDQLTYAALEEAAVALYDGQHGIRLTYVDSDGDVVTITNQADVDELLAFVQDEGLASVHVMAKGTTPEHSLMEHVVAAVAKFAIHHVNNSPLLKQWTVTWAMESIASAIQQVDVASEATSLLQMKHDVLSVVKDAEFRRTLEQLSETPRFKPLTQQVVLAAVGQSECSLEALCMDKMDDLLGFGQALLARCPHLQGVLLRMAENCMAALLQLNDTLRSAANDNTELAVQSIETEQVASQTEEEVASHSEEATISAAVHRHFQCNGCDAYPIVGSLYRSTSVPDVDLCSACFQAGTLQSNGPFDVYHTEQPVHVGVVCDGCERTIIGTRYKALNVHDFDLCETCEASKQWAATHEPFIKITEPSRAPTTQWTGAQPVHGHVVCDDCAMSPIVGVRYKSSVVRDFDLCEQCEASGRWNDTHAPFLKIIKPGRYNELMSKKKERQRQSKAKKSSHEPQECRKKNQSRLDMAFVEDMNINDGTLVGAGSRLTKSWRLKNSGATAWPTGCYLAMEQSNSMNEFQSLDNRKHIVLPELEPGEDCVVEVHLLAPLTPVRHVAYWRVFDPSGNAFGHRLWIDVIVAEWEEESTDDKSPKIREATIVPEAVLVAVEAPKANEEEDTIQQCDQLYEPTMRMLAIMGFEDTETNRKLLAEYDGDVERVVNRLLFDK